MNIIHSSIFLAVGAALCSHLSQAAPFDESRVSGDARWIAHLDVEAMARSQLGQFGLGQLKAAAERGHEGKLSVDFDMILAEIESLTAYGTDLEKDPQRNSVLVVEAGKKLQLIIDGFVANMEANAGGAPQAGEGASSGEGSGFPPPFQRIEGRAYPGYLLGGEVFLAYPEQDLLMLSKDFGQIERAYAVYEGKGRSLAKAKESIVLNREPGFFFIATAAGFGGLENVPHQARILQKTSGGQISLGESEGEFRANLVLATTGAEVSDQLFRIVQGMIALASFATVEDQGLAELTERLDVSQSARSVSVDLRYPTEQILALAQAAMSEEHHGHGESSDHTHEAAAPDEGAE